MTLNHFSAHQATADMNTSSMRMEKSLENKGIVCVELLKSIRGGDICSGIAATVSVCVTNKERRVTVISTYASQSLMSSIISKSHSINHHKKLL